MTTTSNEIYNKIMDTINESEDYADDIDTITKLVGKLHQIASAEIAKLRERNENLEAYNEEDAFEKGSLEEEIAKLREQIANCRWCCASDCLKEELEKRGYTIMWNGDTCDDSD